MQKGRSGPVSFGSFLIRLAIGIIFVWAGLGKLLGTQVYAPEQLAVLATMGVTTAPVSAAPPATPKPADLTPQPPTKPLPPPGGGGAMRLDGPGPRVLAAMATQPVAPGASTEPVRMRKLYQLALLLNTASKPPVEKPSAAPLIPASLGTGQTAVALAWAAALTEVVMGAAVLVGLFTRIAALALVGVMVVAAWLTTIGPAVAVGNGLLGFLPAGEWHDVRVFSTLWLQIMCGLSCLAVVFIGPGGASLDALLASSPAPAGKPPKSE